MAGQSLQKASLWSKAVLTGYNHSHTERESGGIAFLFIHFL
ncbi:hypothetical protein HMPREF1613_04110 [Escherichia coli 908616]|nr:hypothetical protein ECSTECC16502_2608 [Escherichia coli STEC_C165-02]ESD20209.1 hypothetical protein HMPREF1600_04498 [Escherichia coli 907715]ESD49559.1 hypothetical protein HMPREF1605_03817 [Escherichia coli 908521]ESD84286.1 hypothetical protein HMPREF1613_04110 [Escherichia coli 908616]ESD85578.1 hypothetical protein HMPREF1612_03675 [Escherichia coli 908585]KDU02641.1 hypothetical protein AB46_3439 [Escherichia coli 3-267-03_S1_C2]